MVNPKGEVRRSSSRRPGPSALSTLGVSQPTSVGDAPCCLVLPRFLDTCQNRSAEQQPSDQRTASQPSTPDRFPRWPLPPCAISTIGSGVGLPIDVELDEFDGAVRSELTDGCESGDEHALRDQDPVIVPARNQLR